MKSAFIAFLTLAALPCCLQAEAADPALAMFAPLPDTAPSVDNPLSPQKIKLGRKLYFEKALSSSKEISCNSCHGLNTFGVDNQPTSPGHMGQRGDRNSPTVYNAALHFAQFWDGRARDVEEQALGPILNPVEMAMGSDAEVLERIKLMPEYVKLFKEAFPEEKEPMSYANLGKAIGAFERTLLTPSRFDNYLKGDKQALNADEIKGLKTFVESGCTVCHSGAALGGSMYQKLGLVIPYATKDEGRYKVTKNEADKYFFKVPSLRNVEKTGPWFHDGSITSLEESVRLMGYHQLGQKLEEDKIKSIVTFLRTLTGTHPEMNAH